MFENEPIKVLEAIYDHYVTDYSLRDMETGGEWVSDVDDIDSAVQVGIDWGGAEAFVHVTDFHSRDSEGAVVDIRGREDDRDLLLATRNKMIIELHLERELAADVYAESDKLCLELCLSVIRELRDQQRKSHHEIAAELNKHGIPLPQGYRYPRRWVVMKVRRICMRYGIE